MNKPTIEAYRTSKDIRIYRILLDLFPGLEGYAHLVCGSELCALIDVGSGYGNSNEQLETGLAAIESEFGESSGWEDITHILISHGHIDHYGGLLYVQDRCRAPVGIHELDRRILIGYEERLNIVAKRLRDFLLDAGVSQDQQGQLMDLYLFNKYLFKSVPIQFTYDEKEMQIGPIRILHTPGHCPGQVVFMVDDILLSSDHILKNTSPHQAPEQLTLNTGLGHYLESLEKIRPLSASVRVVLGGHEGPFEDLDGRILEIKHLHEDRLAQVLGLLGSPKSVAEISRELFPNVEGYHVLLAIEETGAHVEYLAQRAYISVENNTEIEFQRPSPIRYLRRDGVAFSGIRLNYDVVQAQRR